MSTKISLKKFSVSKSKNIVLKKLMLEMEFLCQKIECFKFKF